MTDVVVVNDLWKSYGKHVALRGLSLTVPQGAVYGLLGPNGAGKSTTFGILCGWLGPSSGSATVLGTPSSALHTLRGRVAALPQDARFPDSIPILHQLTHAARLRGMSKKDARAEAYAKLELVGLADAVGKRGSQLSHGMAKRAGIAQALLGSPEIIFLDEPTAGLDPKNARVVRDVIQSMAPASTVVVSSHNLAEIQSICTHGAILDRGNLTIAGTMDALTGQGERLFVLTRPGVTVPLDTLGRAFPDACTVHPDGRLEIRYEAGRDPAEVSAIALQILLEHSVPILGLERGTSLETAFLALTGAA